MSLLFYDREVYWNSNSFLPVHWSIFFTLNKTTQPIRDRIIPTPKFFPPKLVQSANQRQGYPNFQTFWTVCIFLDLTEPLSQSKTGVSQCPNFLLLNWFTQPITVITTPQYFLTCTKNNSLDLRAPLGPFLCRPGDSSPAWPSDHWSPSRTSRYSYKRPPMISIQWLKTGASSSPLLASEAPDCTGLVWLVPVWNWLNLVLGLGLSVCSDFWLAVERTKGYVIKEDRISLLKR